MKCKNCNVNVRIEVDESNHEFIYKTGYCRMCLIDMGYCS